MAKLKLAVITDIHNGHDSGAKLGSKAPRLLEKFVKAAARQKPDLLIDMGDRITASNKEDSKNNMQVVKDVFNRMALPTYSILGNHDVKYLSRAEIQEIMGDPPTSYSLDVNGYHLVFLNPDVDPDKKEGLHAAEDELKWLEEDLKATDKPAIVFSHVPLDNDANDDERTKKLRENGSNPFFYPEGPEIRKIMEDSGKVILCMAGHLHRNRYREINGIHYLMQQSLTQTWHKEYRVPHGTFSFVELDDNKITIRLAGRSRLKLDEKLQNKITLIPRPLT